MRYIRYACIATFAVALFAVALANRTVVTLKVLPDEIAGLFTVNPSINLPLFVVICGGIIAGLVVGFVWEWFREHSMRAEVSKSSRNVRRLEHEIARIKGQSVDSQNDILSLLDKAS
jgi:putative membrane protein